MKTKAGLLVMLFLFPVFLLAHAPKKVVLSYNKDSKKLSMVINHPVANANNHYINEIIISVDGKEVKTIKPVSQSSTKDETMEVAIPEIKSGSKVAVKAICNKMGSKTAKLTVK
ncbi:MAG: hypothetical protein JXQ69_02810 [Paludibacteraceae bacterium]|nr:hypothetical protein [Paludibacteraceae bacterium]MBN2787233.1 hypothetical protein [Paludibacteraceae bacterium]